MSEKNAWKINGYLAMLLFVLVLALGVLSIVHFKLPLLGVILFVVGIFLIICLTVVQPNNAAVITFFGKYIGCIRENGIWFRTPFSVSKKVSLRVRNFNSEKLKVNDVYGNPIEIAAVVVFKVVNSARAVFDVDNYQQFVAIQSETALRHIAAKYPYDDFEKGGVSLRSNADEVSRRLMDELQERLTIAGVEIMEARLTHLAYATEIAWAMLQRQQASAVLAARQIIVDGAVGMAQMAIEQMEKDGVLQLDQEKKATIVNNLMVSIIADRSSHPIINVGSIY
jgi:regulator of protease activity HflC (stomatin/prohibitin superfamily)